jgi:interleukin-1 receptor-associated kinase 1
MIGEGGPGCVFVADALASLPQAARPVVKRADSAGVLEIACEIEILARCRHPHLLPLLGCCLEPRLPCLVYPLARGGSLEDRLIYSAEGQRRLKMVGCSAPPPLPWLTRVHILRDTLRALVYLHEVASPQVLGDIISEV